MNKKSSLFIILTILIVAGIGCGIAVYAYTSNSNNNVPTVIYDASKASSENANAFSTKNVVCYNNNQYVDLMPEMKNLMPGDNINSSFDLKIENLSTKAGEPKSVKIYLQAEYNADIENAVIDTGSSVKKAYNKDYEKLIADISNMIIVTVDGNKYTGTLDKNEKGDAVGGLICLGEFTQNITKTIGLSFNFPVECGNEYSNLLAELGWRFTAEVTNNPKEEASGGGGSSKSKQTPVVEPEDDALMLNVEDHFAYINGYPDGKVYPEKDITRAEAVTILFRLLTDECRDYYWCETNDYTDVSSSNWFNNAVSTLSKAGIANGYPDGSFKPNDKITRAEMAKVVSAFAQLGRKDSSFKDIQGHWAKEYIEMADGNGWIMGYADNTFKPDQYITRAETVTILNRVLSRVPANESRLLSKKVMNNYSDCVSGKWYYIGIQEASNSHNYERINPDSASDEQWTELIENRDWTELEKSRASNTEIEANK